MPQHHLSCLQLLSQGLVNSQELKIARFSISGTAFAFALESDYGSSWKNRDGQSTF
jgi:hypothetical protein